MSEFKKGFVPIEYANTDRMRFVIPFPEYVKPQQIGVNLSGLERLLRIGGIGRLRVAEQTEGETTRFTPTVVGYNSQGNAYAGKKGTLTFVPEFTTSPNLDAPVSRLHFATWTNAVINLNINEMAQRIRQEDRWTRGVRSTEAWAHHLDEALRKGVRDIGIRHLTLGLNKIDWLYIALQYAQMGTLATFTRFPSVEIMAFSILFGSGCINLIGCNVFRNTDYGSRWSVIIGPQLDRALLLKILSSRTNLVMASSNNPTDSNPQTP